MQPNKTATHTNAPRTLWLLRFTAAAATVLVLASGSAQALSLPSTPDLPDLPISAGSSAQTPIGGASAQADGGHAQACANVDSSGAASAVATAQGAAGQATSYVPALPVPTPGLPALPSTPSLPSVQAEACVDADAEQAVEDAKAEADKAAGEATGAIAKLKSIAQRVISFLPF